MNTGRSALVALALLAGLACQGIPGSAADPASAGSGKGLAAQVSDAEMVKVRVTPLDVSSAAKVWRFEVVFDTHTVELNHDVAAIAVLIDAAGREQKPIAWEGDRPGGHHRKGMLMFKPLNPAPATLTLKLQQVGPVPERSFIWTLAR